MTCGACRHFKRPSRSALARSALRLSAAPSAFPTDGRKRSRRRKRTDHASGFVASGGGCGWNRWRQARWMAMCCRPLGPLRLGPHRAIETDAWACQGRLPSGRADPCRSRETAWPGEPAPPTPPATWVAHVGHAGRGVDDSVGPGPLFAPGPNHNARQIPAAAQMAGHGGVAFRRPAFRRPAGSGLINANPLPRPRSRMKRAAAASSRFHWTGESQTVQLAG